MGKKKQKTPKSGKSPNTTNNIISPTTVPPTEQLHQSTNPASTNNTTTSTTDTTHQSHSNSQHTKSTDHNKDPQQSNDIDQDAQEEQKEQKGFKGQAKKDMQNVEGYVAEREGEVIDEAKLDKAMTFVNEEKQKRNAQKLQKQKDAEKITVSKEDIELIINEMEVTKAIADKYLRENKGNVVEALKAIVNAC
ncbi:huntingtin-interacting protein k [Gigaspora margarita]|uniref:Huntingtin-interacting protein k n=1 Tax=Gigaspora margarita TaxID=4874 RepID=A0A8H4A5E7_GIGMA|nr:huntingtin-interacting protein k [Gigaspora margarita]